MKILVVKTCDGDVYYKGNERLRAIECAEKYLEMHKDVAGEDGENWIALQEAKITGKEKKVFEALVECGAIREREFE